MHIISLFASASFECRALLKGIANLKCYIFNKYLKKCSKKVVKMANLEILGFLGD